MHFSNTNNSEVIYHVLMGTGNENKSTLYLSHVLSGKLSFF